MPYMEIDKRADIFTGQGSQFLGMWEGLRKSDLAMKIFQTADAKLKLDFPLFRLGFKMPNEQRTEELNHELTKTSNTQPLILAYSIAVLRVAQDMYPQLLTVKPKFALRHSLGEYSALVARGAIDLETATYLVR